MRFSIAGPRRRRKAWQAVSRPRRVRSLMPRALASAPSFTIAVSSSLASVGWVTFFGCTVLSTVIRARSFVFRAPAACATRRLSASSTSSLSPIRLRQWLSPERSCGKACWKNVSPVKCWK